jgi:hypothetical protein
MSPPRRANRPTFLDRPTGQVVRRYERDRPGELVHVDVIKLGRIPDGGGHKVLGRQVGRARQRGLRLRPLCRRRPQPSGLQRNPPD